MPTPSSTKIYRKDLSNVSDAAQIGEDCVIHAGVHIHDDVKIGNRCKIQAGAFLPNGVELEDDVFVGPFVVFTNDPDLDGKEFKPVATLVRKRAKIGANATVIAGVEIGEDAVIGAGSVVTKNVPGGETWVGNPAHKL